MELEIDFERGAILTEGRETWVRAYPLGIDAERMKRPPPGRSPSTSRRSCAAAATT